MSTSQSTKGTLERNPYTVEWVNADNLAMGFLPWTLPLPSVGDEVYHSGVEYWVDELRYDLDGNRVEVHLMPRRND